jgi:CHAT domain-containing protein/Flp pilus assembly protein TadD
MKAFMFVIPVFLCSASHGQDWSALNAEGMNAYKAGTYAKAKEYLVQAVAISRKTYGESSDEFTVSLTNLGYVNQAQGDYKSAQHNFRKVVKITQHRYDSIHIDQVESLMNLANVFLPAGEYDSCEFYLTQAQQLIYQAAQERSPHYFSRIHLFFNALINVQNSLGSLYFKKGQVDKAVVLLEQQRQFIRQTYPDDYQLLQMYASTLNNLANYYLAKGNLDAATSIIKEQVVITEKHLTEPLPYLDALNNLGNTYRHREELDSAEHTWNMALAIIGQRNLEGTDVHIYILNNLGELLLARDSTTQAIGLLRTAAELQEKRGAVNPRVYQTTLLNLAESYRWAGTYQEADETYTKLTQLVVDEVLHNFTYLSDSEKISFYRNNVDILESYAWFAFEVSGALKLPISKDQYRNPDALNRLLNLLLTTKGLILHPGYRLKNVITTGSNEDVKSKYQAWEDSKYAYATLRRADTLDVKQVSYLLQQTESLEKWLRTNSTSFKKGFVIENKDWREVQKKLQPGEVAVEMVRLVGGQVYAALILTPSTKTRPAAVFVKSTEKLHLEKQYYFQYANAITHSFQDTLSYEVYWSPILKGIEGEIPRGTGISRIYFSGDGIYNQINLNTLFNKKTKRYVLDETDIRPVTNLKDIVASATKEKYQRDAVLIGRPSFSSGALRETDSFLDLPGTETEVMEIQAMLIKQQWKATLLKSGDARESTIKKVNSPSVLHLATHGFFTNTGAEDFVEILLNSGVALAGANDKTDGDGEDGILTAFEMMNIDLDNTNLVVLSACETGLGKFYAGEGVYGLQRALRSAGAKAVIMSLWKVDDLATQKLMTTFYRLWIKNPRDARAAFRKAQQELRISFPDPKYWGAFVFTE